MARRRSIIDSTHRCGQIDHRIAEIAAALASYDERQGRPASDLEAAKPADPASLDGLVDLATRIAGTPSMPSSALADPAWENDLDRIRDLLATGRRYAALRDRLGTVVRDEAWQADLAEPISALSILPRNFPAFAFEDLSVVSSALPRLLTEAGALARTVGRDVPNTLADVEHLARIGERVGSTSRAFLERLGRGEGRAPGGCVPKSLRQRGTCAPRLRVPGQPAGIVPKTFV